MKSNSKNLAHPEPKPMPHFATRLVKFFAIISISWTFIACSKLDFTVQPLTAQNVRLTGDNSDPTTARTLQFTVGACMNSDSNTVHTPIINEAMEVDCGASKVSTQTDAKGCIYWPESITYQVMAKESYVKFSRNISAHGNYGGTQKVEFAMDPWKVATDGFVDLRITPLTAGTETGTKAKLVLDEKEINSQTPEPLHGLLIHELNIHTYDSQTTAAGTSIAAQFSMIPGYTRSGLDSTEVRETIKKGDFSFEYFLVEQARSGNKTDDQLIGHQSLDVSAVDGVISTVTRIQLTRIPNPTSQILLRFKLSSKSSIALGTQESQIVMDQLLVQGTLAIQPVTNQLDTFKTQAATSAESGFRIDSLKVDYGGIIDTESSTGVAKAVKARLSVCLKDGLNLKPIANHLFEVATVTETQAKAKEFKTLTSDSAGCVFWDKRINFNYYKAEKWFVYHLIVHSTQGPYVNVQDEVKIYLNPWQEGSLFFWDSRNGPAPSQASASQAQGDGSPRIFAKEISYGFIGRDFQLDPYKNIVMNRHYQLRFKPELERSKNYSNELVSRAIQGTLSIRVVIAQGGVAISQYVGNVTVTDGEAVANITLPFFMAQILYVMNRNQIYLEIGDSKSSGLQKTTLKAPFLGIDPDKTTGFTRTNESVQSLVDRLPKGASLATSNLPNSMPIHEVTDQQFQVTSTTSVAISEERTEADQTGKKEAGSKYWKGYGKVFNKTSVKVVGEVGTPNFLPASARTEVGNETGVELGAEAGYIHNNETYTAKTVTIDTDISRNAAVVKGQPFSVEHLILDVPTNHSGSTVRDTWYFVHPQNLLGATLVDFYDVNKQNFLKVIHGDDEYQKFYKMFMHDANPILFSADRNFKSNYCPQ